MKKKSHWRWRGKQVEALKYLKLKEQKKEIEDKSDNKFSIQKENYDKLLDERADEIGNKSREINSIYYFTTPGIAPINFIKFKGPLNIFKKIRDGDKTLQEIEEDQKKFKSILGEITSGNKKKRKEKEIKSKA